MNAANNLALTNIGPAVADHDRHAMNEPATKQDLYNMGVQIDSNFGKVISQFELVNKQFEIVESQFTNLRTDMNAGFDMLRTDMDDGFNMFRTDMDAGFKALHATVVRKLTQIGVITLLEMIAILCVDRWWL